MSYKRIDKVDEDELLMMLSDYEDLYRDFANCSRCNSDGVYEVGDKQAKRCECVRRMGSKYREIKKYVQDQENYMKQLPQLKVKREFEQSPRPKEEVDRWRRKCSAVRDYALTLRRKKLTYQERLDLVQEFIDNYKEVNYEVYF